MEDSTFSDYRRFLQSVLETSAEYPIIAIIALDLEGRVILWNEGAHRIYGYTREEVLGLDTTVLHPSEEARVGVVAKLAQTTLEQSKWEGSIRHRRKSGEVFSARVVMSVRRDASAEPLGFLMASMDATEGERLHARLIASEEYNRGLIEANVDGQIATDPAGIITDLNKKMEELTGRSRAELIGTPFKNYFADPSRAEEGIRRVLAEDRVTNFELTLRSQLGEEIVVSYNATAFRGPGGELRGVFATARDVTEQRQLEAQLRESQTYNRGLIEASSDALVTVDRNGIITDLNRQMERATGYGREELLGSRFRKYFTEPEAAAAGIQRTLHEGHVANYELVLRSRTGQCTPVSVSSSVLTDAAGRLRGVFAAARDITEPKRLRDQLEQRNRDLEVQNRRVEEANRLKSEFLASMSHELRTPLNSIIGFSEFLISQPDSGLTTDQREYLGDIHASGNHLLELINDILDLAKVESGKMDLVLESFSPGRALDEVCSVVKPMIEQKQLLLRMQVASGLESVTLDRLRFKQILFNLLSNAVKFTRERGILDVTLELEPHGGLRLRVVDTGIGISPGDLPRLFRQFEQLSTGPGRRYQGSGLGLYLTKKLVEIQGGTIEVESTIGKGTTFTVNLPTRIDAPPHEGTPRLEPR
jgi:PAS domain S-box-containing protein